MWSSSTAARPTGWWRLRAHGAFLFVALQILLVLSRLAEELALLKSSSDEQPARGERRG
jgi:hypothetical protein